MIRTGLCSLLIAGFAVAAVAQAPLVESIEVRVVNVDVVVTDAAGNPVTGLTRDDFEVLEDGRKQTLTNFYEVRGAAGGTAAQQEAEQDELRARRFFLFVDTSSLHPRVRDEIVSSLRTFVDEQFRPGDQVSVVCWNGQISVLTRLTGEKTAIHAALEKARQMTSPAAARSEINRVQQHCSNVLGLAKRGQLPFRAAYLDCIDAATMEANLTVLESRRLLNALNVTLAMAGGVGGKKVLIVAGAQLPKNPGQATFSWANQLFGRYLTGFDAPTSHYDEERPMVDAVRDFSQQANAVGVTTYLMNAPIPANPMNVTNTSPVDDNGGGFFFNANTGDAFRDIARLTGGVAANHRFDAPPLFDAIRRDLGSYYSLGYRPGERTRVARKLTVRTKNREHVVRARQTFTEKTFSEQMDDRVIANVFNPTVNEEWPIAVRAGKPRKEGATFKVPVEVTFPSGGLTLLPQEKNVAGGFTVWIVVGDLRGALSNISRSPQPINLPVAEEKSFRAEPIVFTAELTVRPGESIISVGVVDQIGNTAGFGRAIVKAE